MLSFLPAPVKLRLSAARMKTLKALRLSMGTRRLDRTSLRRPTSPPFCIATAKPCDRLVAPSADVIFLAGLRTERAQLLDERLARLITPTGNDHLRALLGEGDRAPHAAQSAGDQYHRVAHFQVPHDLTLPAGGA